MRRSEVTLTALIRSDDFQINRPVESRIGERFNLFNIGVVVDYVRLVQANGVVHQHTYEPDI
jgi:hypothetical protein